MLLVAVSVVLLPEQMAVVPVMLTVGVVLTVMVWVAVPVQPFASVPVTEYVPPGTATGSAGLVDWSFHE